MHGADPHGQAVRPRRTSTPRASARSRSARPNAQERPGDSERGLEPAPDADDTDVPRIVVHENVRGGDYFDKKEQTVMILEETIKKLLDLKLPAMAEALRELVTKPPGNQALLRRAARAWSNGSGPTETTAARAPPARRASDRERAWRTCGASPNAVSTRRSCATSRRASGSARSTT